MSGGVALTLALLAGQNGDASTGEIARQATAAFQEGVRLRAEKDSARKQFTEAARLFEELERKGVRNPSLYLDLGNARLLAEDVPGAVLAYHRGLRLAPYQRELQEGLARARSQVLYPTEAAFGRTPPAEWPWLLPRLGSRWLFALGGACYFLAWMGLAAALLARRTWLWIGVGAALIAAIASTTMGIGVLSRESAAADQTLVVIARDGVLLRRGNGWVQAESQPAYPPRYPTPLNCGVEARLSARRGDWLQLELAGGEVGWVPASAVLVDGP
jgi:hypothetical protein